jgi:hypothetical protein
MSLKGMLSTAADGTKGFDCNQVLTPLQVQSFLEDGYKFAIRYVPRVNRAAYDLTHDEAQMILDNGMGVWCDLEGVNPTDSDQQVIDYCDEWYRAVNGAGFNAGLYVGWRTLLSGVQIHNLPFRHYWSAFNLNIDEVPSVRGVQMKQEKEKVAHGVRFDPDVASADLIGDRAWFLWPV